MVKSIVSRNPHAIGYVSAGSIGDLAQLNIVKIDGVLPTPESIIKNKYPLSRPFLFVYKTNTISKEANDFMEYMQTIGTSQKIQALGYVK